MQKVNSFLAYSFVFSLALAVAPGVLLSFPSQAQSVLTDTHVAQSDSVARLAEADQLLRQGSEQGISGNFVESAQSFQQALEIYREDNTRTVFPDESKKGESVALSNLSSALWNLGQYEQAIDAAEQALTLTYEIDNELLRGQIFRSLGLSYWRLGQYDKALYFFEQALAIADANDSMIDQSRALGNLAILHDSLGQYEQSIRFLRRALDISRETSNRFGELSYLNNLGIAHLNLRQYEQSLAFFEEALDIAISTEDRVEESRILGNLGAINRILGNYEEAIYFYEQGLAIARDMNNLPIEHRLLGNLGIVYDVIGQYERAVVFFEQDLAISQRLGDRPAEAVALNNLGSVHNDNGEFSTASEFFLRAIDLYDSIRSENLSDVNQISLFETQLGAYLQLQSSLVAQGEIDRALEISERGRARAFVDLLASSNVENADLSLALAEPLGFPNIAKIQEIAREKKSTLVEYSVLRFRGNAPVLYVWVIQPDGEVKFHQVDLSGKNLGELVSLAREGIGVRNSASLSVEIDPKLEEALRQRQREKLENLYQILIEPIAQWLPRDPEQQIIFIPHESLFLVPFPALVNTEGKYLIENHTILTAPSIQVLDFTRQQNSASRHDSNPSIDALVVGNPIMPEVWNPRTKRMEQLSNLLGAENEALAIANTLGTNALLWNDATKAAVVEQMPQARVIHFATHGLLEYGSPETSETIDVPGAIALAPTSEDGGLLTAAEILQMNLTADLVVLSACDTGQGRITGDGVIGLSRSLIAAGVPSVIVSLWAIDDEATAHLMVDFYSQWQQTGDKAQALRQAMLTTMETHPDPRFWAAFTLIGEAE